MLRCSFGLLANESRPAFSYFLYEEECVMAIMASAICLLWLWLFVVVFLYACIGYVFPGYILKG